MRGLTRDDFSVLENDAPQKIASFEASSTDASGSAAQPNAARTLILLDQLNIDFSDLSYARDRILMYVNKSPTPMPPTALMTIGLNGLREVQDFTQDKELLKSQVVHLPILEASDKGGGIDIQRGRDFAKTALKALSQIARSAVGLPYSVNVIWVTSGFPGLLNNPTENDRLDAGLRDMGNILVQSRMRLYTIDPAGVVPIAGAAAPAKQTRGNIHDSHTSSAEQIQRSTGGEAMTADVLLRHMTKIMGGLSYRGRNDVEVAIGEAAQDGSGGYVISYAPSDSNFHGEYRNIEVRISNKTYQARTRPGYYAIPEDAQSDKTLADNRLEDALHSPVRYEALHVSCPATYDSSKRHLTGKIVVTPAKDAPVAQERDQVIRIASFTKDGKVLDTWIWRVTWKNAWTTRDVNAGFDKVLSPKAYMVRFLVANNTADLIGSCEYPISQ